MDDKAFITKARALRPFYFIVTVWGKRYVDHLLNYCVASLLSPKNIPALLNSGNKFLIATTDEDWLRMQSHPVFRLLTQYVQAVFLPIPHCPTGKLNCMHSSVGHKLATQVAHKDRAYGIVLVPDQIVSDGTLAAVQGHAVNGYQVVLAAWLRFGEEPIFENLNQMGIARNESTVAGKELALCVTGRQLVGAAIRSFHSEVLSCEWEKPYHPLFQIGVWWRVPEEDGIILHSLNWAPLLIDYDALQEHDASTMDQSTIDGDYIYRNFGLNGKVYVIQDSDEAMLVSWGPLEDRAVSLENHPNFIMPFTGEWERGMLLYEALHSPICDPLKREMFARPVYWHANDIRNEKWSLTEKNSLRIIRKYGPRVTYISITGVRPYLAAKVSVLIYLTLKRLRSMRVACKRVWGHICYPISAARYYWEVRQHALSLFIEAIKGDLIARKRVTRSFWTVVNGMTGRQ